MPLVVKPPGVRTAPERRSTRVSTAGVFALVLETVGLEVPTQAAARLPAAAGVPIVAETHPLEVFSDEGSWRALFADDFKLVWNTETGFRLHDLGADPSERVDFTAAYPERAQRMQRALEALLAAAPAPEASGPVREVDAETLRALESLGYLE